MEKALFDITGMTCSACSARIEKRLSKIEGIEEVSVNLLTNSMSVTFDTEQINTNQIVKKVEGIGYGASPKISAAKKLAEKPMDAAQSEAHSMRNRLIVSLIFTIPLFYISMGEMLGWPLVGYPRRYIYSVSNSLILRRSFIGLSLIFIFTPHNFYCFLLSWVYGWVYTHSIF